jgi:hypothetical protein
LSFCCRVAGLTPTSVFPTCMPVIQSLAFNALWSNRLGLTQQDLNLIFVIFMINFFNDR